MGKKSTSSSEPSEFAKPFIQQGSDVLSNTFNSNIGNIQGLTNDITGTVAPDLLNRFQQGDAGVNAARDYNVDVLGGNYLNNNPYLDDLVAQSNYDVRNDTQAALGLRGLTGGSDYADILSDNLARNTLNLRFNDYNNERSRQATAASQAPGLAQADLLPVNSLLGTLSASQAPLNAAATYAGGLGGLLGGSNTQTSSPSTFDSVLGGLGTAASAAALFSDERLKENVSRVGETDGGLGVYTYTLKGDPTPRMGVMAQEVEQSQPEALGPEVSGFKTVNYAEVR